MEEIMKKRFYLIVPIFGILVSLFFVGSTVDFKIRDLFFKLNNKFDESKKVILVNIDDSSIENVGSFPWTRDIYAESILVLKELGAKNITLDLNFVDSSSKMLFVDCDQYLSNYIKVVQNVNIPMMMVNQRDVSRYDEKFVKEKFALKNAKGHNDTVTKSFDSIWPCLDAFSYSTKDYGFVNAEPDRDGKLRKIHLVAKCDDKYYGQLMFNVLLRELGNPVVEISNEKILLKDCNINEQKKDIELPRDETGAVILNFPKKDFFDYNAVTAWNVYRIKLLENDLVANVLQMEDDGFFSFTPDFHSPYVSCLKMIDAKEFLFSDLTIDEKLLNERFEKYLKIKNEFFTQVQIYLDSSIEELLLEEAEGDDETTEYIKEYFITLRKQNEELTISKEKVKSLVQDSFCIIGTCASSTTDYNATLYQERYPNVGVNYVLANMILSGENFIKNCKWYYSFIFAIILSFMYTFYFSRKKSILSKVIVGIVFVILSILIPFILFVKVNIYFGMIIPLCSITVTFAILILFSTFVFSKEKHFLQNAFGKYLLPTVIENYIENPENLKLGGNKVWMTAMFTDIRGFSTISEKLEDPQKLVSLLNKYLTTMSDIILANGGTIDKYEGDAIIAFFGAPIYDERHAINACRAAVQMKKAEIEFNKMIHESGECDDEIFTRIGINTGDIVVGNMGTNSKMNYTMMGSAVNLASRLEGVNKQYGTKGIIISETTKNEISNNFAIRTLDRVRVVGIKKAIRIFEVIDETEFTTDDKWRLIEKWQKAIYAYETKEFESAKKLFDYIHRVDKEDSVAKLYSARCTKYLKTPPTEKWDNIINLTEK